MDRRSSVTGTADTIPAVTEHEQTDPWEEAGKRWASISDKLKEHYRGLAGEDGPGEAEIKSAFDTLGEAARTVADSVGSAMRDPDVREQVKEAAASFVTALGQTFSQLGDELRRAREHPASPPPPEPSEDA